MPGLLGTERAHVMQHTSHQSSVARPTTRSRRARAAAAQRCRSVRERKDPRQFASMDNARDFLHSQAGETGFISGLLNWLSDQAFGASRGQVRGAGAGAAPACCPPP